MSQLGISNADIVRASTEQLTFKMVQRGRKGRRLTPNIQDKILKALLTVKPELKLGRRHLFRYELEATVVEAIRSALSLAQEHKIKYPQFVDLLAKAGVTRYLVEIAAGRITFFGIGGEAYIEQGPALGQASIGKYDEAALQAAISDSQKQIIDHSDFLKRIYGAGIFEYEANIRSLTIAYKSAGGSYKEKIPPFVPGFEKMTPNTVEEEKVAKKTVKRKSIQKKNNVKRIKKTGKFVVKHRVKKRRFMRRK